MKKVIRAKTTSLIATRPLTEKRQENSELNMQEMRNGTVLLKSKPRRLVFELTSSCNLNCIMCGRNAAEFKPSFFDIKWFDKFDNIFDEIEEVTLMGWGEPTIHPQFPKMLEFLHSKGVRIYFCTNGMKLDKLTKHIFDCEVDVFAVSLDGANEKTNSEIRSGSDFNRIVFSLKEIVKIKKDADLRFPYINFVFTAMKRNLHEIPDLVRLASDIGIEEVKVVYLTAFEEEMAKEILIDEMDKVKSVFEEATKIAQERNILIKLPYIKGCDVAGDKAHKDCFTTYRDFFLGSDGYVRACMSNSIKLFHIDKYSDFESAWNSSELMDWRKRVNTDEMYDPCKACYQSSFANWNRKHAFDQRTEVFSPKWD